MASWTLKTPHTSSTCVPPSEKTLRKTVTLTEDEADPGAINIHYLNDPARPSGSNQPPRRQKEVKLDPELAARLNPIKPIPSFTRTTATSRRDQFPASMELRAIFQAARSHRSLRSDCSSFASRNWRCRTSTGLSASCALGIPRTAPTLVDLDLERLAFDLNALATPVLICKPRGPPLFASARIRR
ncbi:hypothetical protein C8J57DRAFT_1510871 [Mycena rebaudengoi]|nr:hypothetical protein C8J57DRAFT_1510871 [Mycena rebaudengoi]